MKTLRTTMVLGLALFTAGALSGDARAYQVEGSGRLKVKISAKILELVEGRLAKGPKTVAKIKEKQVFEAAPIDGRFAPTVRLFANNFRFDVPGTFPDASERKSKIAAGEDDVNQLFNAHAIVFVPESVPTAKPKIESPFLTFDTVESKGKVVVSKNLKKIKLNTSYSFTGFVGGRGEYAGHPVKGKIEFKYSGDVVQSEE